MSETTFPIEIYQFRVVLRETSPHIWRRLLVRSDSTLITFHRVIQSAFGWSGRRGFSFNIQGHRQQAAAVSDPCQVTLGDVRLYPKERFSYDEAQEAAAMSRPWSFLIRLEKKLPLDARGRYPRCIAGSGAPVPEDCGGPLAYDSFRDLFTPDYIVHRLAELLDEGWSPEHLAELRQLRPWMDRDLARREINRRLQAEPAAVAEGVRP
jgi:hypothetical protein